MTCCRVLKALTVLAMGICLLLIGCGKKAETQKGTPDQVRPPQTQIEEYLAKQTVSCEGNQACPNYIAKIVVVQGSKYKFCTGFLTDDNIVATSSSCLPSLLRLNGQDCSKDVFFFFPKTPTRPAESVGCTKVQLISQLPGQDPVLWRDDVAFLEINKELRYRRQAQIVRDGVGNNRQFSAWMIDQQDDISAIVKKATCESVHNNYVNPLVLNESSPNMLFADCLTTTGATGAPVIDNRGKVRAMITRKIDAGLRTYLENTGLLTNGLKEMFHATNFACAPTLNDNDMLDERECLKDLTYSKVDRIRSEMLSTNLLFGDLKKKFEESLNKVSKYVEFGVKLIPKGDVQDTEIYPKCFKPLNIWLESLNNTRNTYVDDVTLPVRSFRRVMDPYGRISGLTVKGDDKETFVQFSLKNLRNYQRSSILMWSGREPVQTFPGVTEECTASLY